MIMATVRKDIQLLARDRGAVMSLFALPVVFIAVFGTIFGGGDHAPKVPVTEWHADASADKLVGALDATGVFKLTHATSEADALAAANDKDQVGLIVPRGVSCNGPQIDLVIANDAAPQLRG